MDFALIDQLRVDAGGRRCPPSSSDYADLGVLVARVRELAPGGVDAVFDNIGGATLRESWKLLTPKGTLVSYAISSSLDRDNSVFLTVVRVLTRLRCGICCLIAGERRSTTYGAAACAISPHSGPANARISPRCSGCHRRRADWPRRRAATAHQRHRGDGTRRIAHCLRQGHPRALSPQTAGWDVAVRRRPSPATVRGVDRHRPTMAAEDPPPGWPSN